MTSDRLYPKSLIYLSTLCNEITERCVGSEGNRQATYIFEKELTSPGWEKTMSEFEAMNWEESGAVLRSGEIYFNVLVSPYTLGFNGEAELVSASSITELENLEGNGKIILLTGEIAKEQVSEQLVKLIAFVKKPGLHGSLLYFYPCCDCSCCHNKNSQPTIRTYPG